MKSCQHNLFFPVDCAVFLYILQKHERKNMGRIVVSVKSVMANTDYLLAVKCIQKNVIKYIGSFCNPNRQNNDFMSMNLATVRFLLAFLL